MPSQTYLFDSNTGSLPLQAPTSDAALWQEIEKMQQDIQTAFDESYATEEFTVNIVAATGISLTAGIVAWLTRAGSLLASLLTVFPVWKSVDPLSILVVKSDDKDRQKEGSSDNAKQDSADSIEKLFNPDK
ncbi:MAG: hypothetical protein LZF61_01120 [Nitrosomonas sp.]|nr:MAG: hypothetical protein LZF61_01120 [Nitrosomonas sp.]